MQPFESRIVPSLLDRLTTRTTQGRPEGRLQSLRELKDAVSRDLMALLNTRRRENEFPEEFTECTRSLLTFGLPDFMSYGLANPTDQQRLRRAVEATIRRFEPRLELVTVTFEPPSVTDRAMRFRIDAMLRVEPAPEPVTFETVLQPDNRHFVMEGRTS